MTLWFYFKDALKEIFNLCNKEFFKKSLGFLLVVLIFDISLIILSVIFFYFINRTF